MPPDEAWAWTPGCAAMLPWFVKGMALSASCSTPPVEWTFQSVARLNAGGAAPHVERALAAWLAIALANKLARIAWSVHARGSAANLPPIATKERTSFDVGEGP